MKSQVRANRHVLIVMLDLGGSRYGTGVSQVYRSLPLDNLTWLPQAPHPVRGSVSLMGRVIPVFEAHQFLGQPPATPADESRVVVLGAGQRCFGLLVDAVAGLIAVPVEDVLPQPGPGPVYALARADWQVSLLDLPELLALLVQRAGGWPSPRALQQWTARRPAEGQELVMAGNRGG